jgi:Zn-dependent peptidase ImmA (M78 family)
MLSSVVEQQAGALLAQHGIVQPPVNVEAIAHAEGVQVVRTESTSGVSGFLLRDDHRTIIGLNASNNARRQRFTIAHELGHWRLHRGQPLIVDHTVRINRRDEVSSAATDSQEIDANGFAAALLMPQTMVQLAFQQALEKNSSRPQQLVRALAQEFNVSIPAMTWRLVNLGLVS